MIWKSNGLFSGNKIYIQISFPFKQSKIIGYLEAIIPIGTFLPSTLTPIYISSWCEIVFTMDFFFLYLVNLMFVHFPVKETTAIYRALRYQDRSHHHRPSPTSWKQKLMLKVSAENYGHSYPPPPAGEGDTRVQEDGQKEREGRCERNLDPRGWWWFQGYGMC